MAQCLNTINLFYINALLCSLLSFVQWLTDLMIRSEKYISNCTLNNSSIVLRRLMIIQHSVSSLYFFRLSPGHTDNFVSYGEQTLKSYVDWTVHHCGSWRIKDQLDVTCYKVVQIWPGLTAACLHTNQSRSYLNHLVFYFTSYVLKMFRTLIYPSSGACDYPIELPHWSYWIRSTFSWWCSVINQRSCKITS